MLAPAVWFKPLSKFVLEVSPVVSAILIGGYLVSGFHWQPTSAETLGALALPDAAVSSGEELTTMINAAHEAVAHVPIARQSQAATERSVEAAAVEAPEPRERVAPARAPSSPRTAARPSRSATAMPPAEKPATLPAPPVAAAPAAPAESPPIAEATWYGKTWGTVAGWGEKTAKVTRLDYVAGVVVETPSAVVRAGKKTIGAVADLVVPESRR